MKTTILDALHIWDVCTCEHMGSISSDTKPKQRRTVKVYSYQTYHYKLIEDFTDKTISFPIGKLK